MTYDHAGNEVTAADVLDDWERGEYARAQWTKPRSQTPRRPQRQWIDGLGYDQWGQWHPEAEQA